MAIVGARSILPPGSNHLRPGRAELRVGEPIPTLGLKNNNGKDLIRTVQEKVSLLAEPPIESGR